MSGSSSTETTLSCIKTELKRCTMTESLSAEVPVKRSPNVVRKERSLALNAPWDSIAVG